MFDISFDTATLKALVTLLILAAEEVLRYTRTLARTFDSEILLLSVRSILEVSASEHVDLIMMTTHGRGALEREAPIGSVADRVIDAANCPVFLVPI